MLARHHQVALLHPDLDRVLVVDGSALPRLTERWPSHRDLVALVGDPRAFLSTPPRRAEDGTVTNVMLGSTDEPACPGGRWQSLATLDDPAADVVRRAVADLRDGPPDDGRAPWYVRGWRTAVEAWVAGLLDGLGCVPTGPSEPVKVWSLSAVLRFPVRRAGVETDLWFKATCDGFRAEPGITAVLADLAPALLPGVLATDLGRAWMLLDPIPGADEGDVDHVAETARAVAGLQLAALARRADLLAAGAPDRGLHATLAGLHTVLTDTLELPQMSDEQRASALAMEPWLAERVRELWSLGLPDALVHGDLHVGNVAWVDDAPVLFDWTDACWSHPYLDARHLAQSATWNTEDTKPVRAAVWAAYVEPWRAAHPHVDHERAWALTEVVDGVFTAISYEQIYRAQPDASRWELASVVVELLDRLAALRSR